MARDYGPILAQILTAANAALTDSGAPPGRVELVPGQRPAWDDCCEGQLYLRVVEIYPSVGTGQTAPFPAIDTQQRGAGCGIRLLAFHLALGVIRCAAVVNDDGTPPTPGEVTADGLEAMADMSVLLDVLTCDVPGMTGVMKMKLDKWTPQGVNGGCHGGEWSFYIAVDPCLPCIGSD